ncbi:DUF4958 family protein [Sphingobacterium arenae]|uniref:DUF4958 family protein n=2 Tax=Sphingobacterium arenae TaxID=1280598 RepID=A0ABR7Y7C5_9SPHI|nr:DUF4958 family protein [Sphingobacterium arenae]
MNHINIKMKWKQYLIILWVSLFVTTACEKTEVVDSTDFTLYYTGMTDIGPSMTGVINPPSYIGAAPTDFKIAHVMLDDVTHSVNNFEIDSETGSISIKETSDMPVGVYKLTISCSSNGTRYEFKDALAINMMKPVPDGITVTPNKLTVSWADVVDASSPIELPTAQVTTDDDHVSITKYEIARSDFSKYFAISSSGLISIVRGDASLSPGKYVLALKLTTGASKEDEGIFENAIEIDVTSEPLALTYTPAQGKLEEESELSGKTTFRSNTPALKGSTEGVQYAIKNILPATDKIIINPQTGVISVAENHGLTAGQKYTVTVNVKNAYATEGVDFEDVFELDVVEYIEPIANFTYQNVDAIQAVAFDISLDDDFKGDEVRFEFLDLPSPLQGNITLDHVGNISSPKGNTIPIGNYTIKVKATNPKSEEANPTIASFTLTVRANPNYFTYVRYGNNLGLSPAENYANQFRIAVGAPLSSVSPTPTTDAKVSVTYEIQGIHQGSGTTIDINTGKITLGNIAARNCGVFMVTATAGKGTPSEYSIQTPVFFHNSEALASPSNASEMVVVEYSPFVFQVNPGAGGRSIQPNINGANNMSRFTLDYRRNFNYYNFFGTHGSGQPNGANTFLQNLWNTYAQNRGINPNYGSRDPLSYFGNVSSNTHHQTLAYIDPNTFQVIVNPNKWTYNGEAANGVMVGQVTFETNGNDPASGGQIFPIVLWFDSKF